MSVTLWLYQTPTETKSDISVAPTAAPTPSPVTPSQMASSLRSHLKLDDLPLASTDAGKEFAIKALHPAENSIKAVRCPIGGNHPTAVAQLDAVFTLPVTNSSLTVAMTSDPVCPLSISVPTSASTMSHYNWYSTLLSGAGLVTEPTSDVHNALTLQLAELAQQYRVNALSVTAHLIAPDLANQGFITAAQYTSTPQCTVRLQSDATANAQPMQMWARRPPATASQVIQGTTAYTGQAKEGVYIPYKISNMGKWRSTTDLRCQYEAGTTIPALPGQPLAVAAGYSGFPYNVACLALDTQVAPAAAYHPQDWNCAMAWFTGLSVSPAVAVQFRIRQVIELVPWPSTAYASLAEPPLPEDELAVKMYLEVSAKMKDAYPASYNDFAKLRSVISSLAKRVLPYVDPALTLLSSVPGIPGLVAGGVKTIKDNISGYRKNRQNPRSSRQ